MVTFEKIGGDGDKQRTERRFEPLAFVRFIQEKIEEERPDEARFREDEIGGIELRKMFGDTYKVEFRFHERFIDGTFEFSPSRSVRHGGSTRQGTKLSELGGPVGKTARVLRAAGFLPFEFAELDASSVGHENLTDYEFTYESSVTESDMIGADIDESLLRESDVIREDTR